MDVFDEMKKYRVDSTHDDTEEFNIPLEPDEDGMMGRECPNEDCQPKYFKMSSTIPDIIQKKIGNFSQMDVTCPYCGVVENMQRFHTEAQIEWIKSMIFKDVAKTLQGVFGNTFKTTSKVSKGMFSLDIKYKPGTLPNVRYYVEEKLKQIVICDECNYRYAVYGISFHCPLCGKGNIHQHLNRSYNIIRVLIDESERIGNEKGLDIGQQMLGNALEDIVSLFEAFLKYIYRYSVKRSFIGNEAESKISKIGINFQRLEKAENLCREDLKLNLFELININDKRFIQEQFLKRHVLTHNLGLIDEKYLKKVNVFERQGSEIELKKEDIFRFLDLTRNILTNIIKQTLKENV